MTEAVPVWPDFDETQPFHRWVVRTCLVCGKYWEDLDAHTFFREWRQHCADHRQQEGTK